jgi:hypothetical protein
MQMVAAPMVLCWHLSSLFQHNLMFANLFRMFFFFQRIQEMVNGKQKIWKKASIDI